MTLKLERHSKNMSYTVYGIIFRRTYSTKGGTAIFELHSWVQLHNLSITGNMRCRCFGKPAPWAIGHGLAAGFFTKTTLIASCVVQARGLCLLSHLSMPSNPFARSSWAPYDTCPDISRRSGVYFSKTSYRYVNSCTVGSNGSLARIQIHCWTMHVDPHISLAAGVLFFRPQRTSTMLPMSRECRNTHGLLRPRTTWPYVPPGYR